MYAMARSIQITLLLLLPACAALPAYEEPAVPDMDQARIPSAGSQVEFVEELRSRGATNVVVSEGMLGSRVVGAVMADHLQHVYLFLDGGYLDRVEIPSDAGSSAVRSSLKVVNSGDEGALVLVAEGLEIEGKATGLLALFDEGGVVQATVLPLNGFSIKHGGLKDPYIGGTDLETGILFSARSEEGRAWSRVYVLSLMDKKIGLDALSSSKACFCASYLAWKQGQDGRTLFGMVVE